MATIKLTTNPLVSAEPFSCIITQNGPSKKVEAKTMAEIKSAIAAFAEELKATGKPWSIFPIVIAGRAPTGFNKTPERELRALVNVASLETEAA
jgi:hypothetical protein